MPCQSGCPPTLAAGVRQSGVDRACVGRLPELCGSTHKNQDRAAIAAPIVGRLGE
jgi:hypothetical protein